MARPRTTNGPMSIEEKQEKLNKLKSYDWTVLESALVSELYELTSGLIPQVKKLRKAELLEKIAELIGGQTTVVTSTPTYKPILASWLEEPLTTIEQEILTALEQGESYKGIQDYLRLDCYDPMLTLDSTVSSLEEAKEVIQQLSFEILRKQAANYEPATQARNKSHFNNLIKALAKTYVNDADHKLMVLVAPFFINCLNKAFQPTKQEVTRAYQGKVAKKTKVEDETEVIDLYPALTFSYRTLEDLCTNKAEPRLEDVVFAVMLATGRRPTEVMSCSSFEPNEAAPRYSVLFGNPAKLKGSMVEYWKDRKVVIPTILPAKWVLTAIEFIRTKMAQKSIKENTVAKGLERLLDKKQFREDGFTKSYRTRAAYVHAAFENHRQNKYSGSGLEASKLSLTGFGSVVLCHNEGDLGTINSYLCTSLKSSELTIL